MQKRATGFALLLISLVVLVQAGPRDELWKEVEEAEKKGVKIAAGLQCRHSPARAALMTGRDPMRLGIAYGVILPAAVLEIPVHGCWNIHASLLPRWRGAAPIQRAIEAGDREGAARFMKYRHWSYTFQEKHIRKFHGGE